MSGLNLIILTPDAERFRGALMAAAASAAIGETVAIFLQLDAVRLWGADAPRDAEHRAAGLPSLAQLIEDAGALGVRFSLCQTGMTLAGMDAAQLGDGVDISGPVAFLAEVGGGRLVLV